MSLNEFTVAPRALRPVVALAAVCVFALGACGGEKKSDSSAAVDSAGSASATTAATSQPAGGPSTSAPGGTTNASAASAAGGGAPATGPLPPGATPAMVAEGDSIFHGQKGGGTCFTCHGADAKGTPLAPPLAGSHKWLTGDGSYSFLVKRIKEGVPTPTPPYSAAMPPMGGAQLTPAQVNAVAAYVYSISHTA
jgi:mono/diheme cytochrome c family protein